MASINFFPFFAYSHFPRSFPKRIRSSFLARYFLGLLDEISLALVDDEAETADLVFFARVCAVLAAFFGPVLRDYDVERVPNNIHLQNPIRLRCRRQ